MQMSTQISPAVKPDQPSTRHLVVDARFAGLLAEDFGISAATILDALSGEPQKQAIAITEWAAAKDDSAGALLAWSRKHRRGAHRRCGQGRCLPTERPGRRHGGLQGNRSAPGRGTTPSAGAAVASGGWGYLDPQIIAAGFARMGV